jgi:hypothetical protein
MGFPFGVGERGTKDSEPMSLSFRDHVGQASLVLLARTFLHFLGLHFHRTEIGFHVFLNARILWSHVFFQHVFLVARVLGCTYLFLHLFFQHVFGNARILKNMDLLKVVLKSGIKKRTYFGHVFSTRIF